MRRIISCTTALLLVLAATAGASTIINTSGNVGGGPVVGRATFDFDQFSFTLTLENLTTNIADNAQVLTAFGWTMAGAQLVVLTGAAGASLWQCPPDHGDPCYVPIAPMPVNSGWTQTGLSVHPSGGLKPYGLVNDSLVVTSDGLGVANHNPMLKGPLVFTFGYSLTGDLADVGVSSAVFTWGTTASQTTDGCVPGAACGGQVAEPASLLLLGGGLLTAGLLRRRR